MIIIYTLFSLYTPILSDDLIFLHKYYIANGGSYSFSLHGLYEYAHDIWNTENGRLANMLCAPILIWLPGYIKALLIACVISFIFLISTRIIDRNWHLRPITLMTMWILSILLFPWHDYSSLMLTDYALNYLVSAALTLCTLFATYYSTTKRIKPGLYILILITAFSCGAIHEGFSLPLLGSLTILSIIRRHPSSEWWGIFLSLLAGTIICLSSPAIWNRLADNTANQTLHLLPYLRHLCKNTPLMVIALSACGMSLFFKKGRQWLMKNILVGVNLYLVVLAFLSGIMHTLLLAPARATICTTLPLIILLINIIRPYLYKIPIKISYMLIASCMLIVWAFYINVLHWQYRIYQESNEIQDRLCISNNRTIYYDIIRSTPWWTLRHPISDLWYSSACFTAYNIYYERTDTTALVIPEIIKNYDFKMPVPIPESKGFFQAGNYVLIKDLSLICDDYNPATGVTGNWKFTLSSGKIIGSYVTFLPFFNSEGDTWFIGIPGRDSIEGPFLNITPAF